MTDFDLLLTTTTFLRGMGAGVIFGMAVITLPVRKRLGTKIYATFIKAHYKENGVKIYAGITVLGLLFTGWLAIITYTDNYPLLYYRFFTGHLVRICRNCGRFSHNEKAMEIIRAGCV